MSRFLIFFTVFVLLAHFVNAQGLQNCELVFEGKCTDCNDTYSFEINKEEVCKKLCPNRKVFRLSGQMFCGLEKCPENYPLRDEENGDCLAKGSEERDLFEGQSKEIDASVEQYGVKAIDGKCPSDKPLLSGSKQWCFPCDYPFDIGTSVKNAELCPNRISIPYPWDDDKNYTVTYLPCPKDKPLRSWSGKCFSCDYPGVVSVITQCLEDDTICDVCPNRIILPQPGGNRPSILKCPPDKPLMGADKICFSCDIDIPIETAIEGDCEKYCSSKRKQIWNECVKVGLKLYYW